MDLTSNQFEGKLIFNLINMKMMLFISDMVKVLNTFPAWFIKRFIKATPKVIIINLSLEKKKKKG